MNHCILYNQSQQSGTMPSMQLLLQRRLNQRLSNMHEQHPTQAIARSIIFNKVPDLLLDDHTHVGAMPLVWPKETAFAVALGRYNGVLQA